MNSITTMTALPYIKFLVSVTHPNFDECYAYGYEAAIAEGSPDDNPYRDGTREHDHWLEGWWAGFYGEEPLYALAAANESTQEEVHEPIPHFTEKLLSRGFLTKMLKITGALAATAVVGYQVLDMVA